MSGAGDPRRTHAPRRLPVFYGALLLGVVAVVAFTTARGSTLHAQPQIAGGYAVRSPAACLGSEIQLQQSGQFLALSGPGGVGGKLRLRHDRIEGTVQCRGGGSAPLRARPAGARLVGTVGGRPFLAAFDTAPPAPGAQLGRTPASLAGRYQLSPRSACLGGMLTLSGDGRVRLKSEQGAAGTLQYRHGALSGTVRCLDGGVARLAGDATGRKLDLRILPARGPAEHVVAQRQRQWESLLAAFFIAVAVVMLFARLVGALAVRIHQPRVMGEIAAGILLGPTLLGAIAPDLQASLFPEDVIPYLGVAANLGLIFYMFLVGLELDLGQLRGRVTQAAAISNSGVVIPMLAGLLVALPLYELLAPDRAFLGFALFMGVSMSITAFPVLARILVERRMLKRPLGAIALASAAIDDVTAWLLIALASAVAVAGSTGGVVRTVALAVGFCAVMWLAVRRLLARLAVAYDEAGRVPVGWVTAIFAGVLLAAFTTEMIGIAVIFGAFVMGTVMPRHAGLTEDVTRRLEDFVVVLLLPLFFAYTGLRTDVGLLDRWELVLLTLVLIAVAIVCKFGGTVLAARVTGMGWRESAVLGTLLNTRGLTELIVLNLALDKGVISNALFVALVLMALLTTFMTGPMLHLLDPRNEYGAPVEDELAEARARSEADTPVTIPDRSILVAPQAPAAMARLLALAEPLARSNPPRELILARAVRPPRSAAVRGGLQTETRLLASAEAEVEQRRRELLERGVAARAVAFTTVAFGADIARLAAGHGVDLVLIDGRRPLVGAGVPRGELATLLQRAPCDVGVLVAREADDLAMDGRRPVSVPFGGAEHDWAALELGAWLAAATGARLRLLGSAGRDDGAAGAGRLLADASLLVQGFTGVASEQALVEPGLEGVVAAAADSALLIVGLSERWEDEGLGETRAEIVRAARWPILFVRRGTRPGALAPRESMTQFGWSLAPSAGGRL